MSDKKECNCPDYCFNTELMAVCLGYFTMSALFAECVAKYFSLSHFTTVTFDFAFGLIGALAGWCHHKTKSMAASKTKSILYYIMFIYFSFILTGITGSMFNFPWLCFAGIPLGIWAARYESNRDSENV